MTRFQFKHRCMVVKYAKDTRYSDDRMSTHDRRMMEARSCATLADLRDDWRHVDVIGIDEGQFFADLLPFCVAAASVCRLPHVFFFFNYFCIEGTL